MLCNVRIDALSNTLTRLRATQLLCNHVPCGLQQARAILDAIPAPLISISEHSVDCLRAAGFKMTLLVPPDAPKAPKKRKNRTNQCTFQTDDELNTMLSVFSKQLEADVPGLKMSRSKAIRILLFRGLGQAGITPVK